MRGEKIKRVEVKEQNIDMNTKSVEVNNMKCPMCGLDESHQTSVESDGMTKPKCTGCGTIFYDPNI